MIGEGQFPCVGTGDFFRDAYLAIPTTTSPAKIRAIIPRCLFAISKIGERVAVNFEGDRGLWGEKSIELESGIRESICENLLSYN